MNKFEKLIEYIINEDEAKAKALFHRIVVEKSRDIYESLVEDDLPIEAGDGAESFGDEISADQDVIDGDEEGMDGGDELGGDDMGDELGGDDMGGEGDMEDRVMDLEDAIDELKAEFDSLVGGEEGDDMGGDDEFGGDMGGEEDFGGEESDFDQDDEGGDDVGGGELDDDSEVDGEAKFGEASVYGGQTGNSKTMEGKGKSPQDLMREYVEKVSMNWPKGASEGDEIGAGGKKQPINTKSNVINGKNDMGGTTANIAKGGAASDRDSNTGPKAPNNEYTKGGGAGKKMGQDKYENSPAANTKGYKDKQQAKTKEGADTKGTQTVDKKSFNPGGTPGFKG